MARARACRTLQPGCVSRSRSVVRRVWIFARRSVRPSVPLSAAAASGLMPVFSRCGRLPRRLARGGRRGRRRSRGRPTSSAQRPRKCRSLGKALGEAAALCCLEQERPGGRGRRAPAHSPMCGFGHFRVLASPARGAERVRQASGGRGFHQGRAAPARKRRSAGRSRRPSEGVVWCRGASPPGRRRSFQEVPGPARGNLAERTRTLSAAPRRWRTRRLSVRRRGVIASARVVRRGRRRRPPPSPPNVKTSVGSANSTCALPSTTREETL